MIFRPLLIATLTLSVSACWISPAEIQDRLDALDVRGGNVDTGQTSPQTLPTDPSTTTPSKTSTVTDSFDCADDDLGNAFGDTLASGDTTGAGDDHDGSCGPSPDGEDHAYVWEAPGEGCWLFGVQGDAFNDKIYVLDRCEGEELGCSDTAPSSSDDPISPTVGIPLSSGQSVLIVVDGGLPEESGAYTLDVRLGLDMPEYDDMGTATGTYHGTTIDADDTLEPMACAFNSGADVLLRWAAPASGKFRFTLDPEGTDFDSVLSVHLPCASDALACDDAFVPFEGGGETVEVDVERGTPLVIRVAGYQEGHETATGDFQLTVRRL